MHSGDPSDSIDANSGTDDLSPSSLEAKPDLNSLPVTPDTPVIPSTPVSLINNAGLLSPGLASPGAQSTSSGSGSGVSDPVHDLLPELLAAGWRRFWSRREGRPYFYNKLTSESRWEMPPVTGQVLK
jgi:hypothetical protein